MHEPPRTDRPVSVSPAVLVPVIVKGTSVGDLDVGSMALASIAAVAAGATGLDLTIPDPSIAVAHGLAIADELGDTAGVPVFIRSQVPFSPGRHTRIVHSSGDRLLGRSGPAGVVDLGLDRLGLDPDADDLARHWPDGPADPQIPFMISTVGFEAILDAEVMALATMAAMRGAAAISSDQPRIVRRVVDTVAAIPTARGAA